jgi:peptide/nickel transport system substrate-binding protein
MGALAGCPSGDGGGGDGGGGDGDGGGGDGGGGQQELGERVPPLVIEFWAGHPVWDPATPLIQQQISNALNHEVQVRPVEVSKMVSDAYNDRRNYHYVTWGTNSAVTTLDPGTYFTTDLVIDAAGANNRPSAMNYADCEFTDLAYEQGVTGDPEERRAIIERAIEIHSQDRAAVNFLGRDIFTGVRTDLVSVSDGSVGSQASQPWNPAFFSGVSPESGDQWVYGNDSTGHWERTNWLMISAAAIGFRANVTHTPLLQYDPDWELSTERGLASNVTVEDNARTITFEIMDDATFHNGDDITAEAVRFTMETIENFELPQRVQQNYESINIIDDKTIEFNFAEPNPSFTSSHCAIWGILHPPTWESMENPADFEPEPPIVGSGPLQMTSWSQGQNFVVEPHPEGHPVYDVDAGFVFQRFQNAQTKQRALQQGEINIAGNMTGSGASQTQEQVGDALEILRMDGFGAWHLAPSYARAPVKFNAFQDAVGMSLNRNALNEVVYAGLGSTPTTSALYKSNHPFYPEDDSNVHNYTDNLDGEPEAARQRLRDAGWGYDDNGNLRYPANADTSPLWPEGEEPSEEDGFVCMSGDEFNQDWEPES